MGKKIVKKTFNKTSVINKRISDLSFSVSNHFTGKQNLRKKLISLTLIIIFTITILVIPVEGKSQYVIIGGEPFGLKLYCEGVMVTKFEKFLCNNQYVCPAKESGIKENDIITHINNVKVKTNEQLGNLIANSNEAIDVKVLRNNKIVQLKIAPKRNKENVNCLGIWVRDSCAGIGTITYYNPTDSTFGGLGHGICDIDAGGLMISDKVEVLKAEITGVSKSTNNNIGSLNGYFKNEIIADAGFNNNLGIFGTIKEYPNKNRVLLGNNNDIKIDDAQLYTTIKGSTPEEYNLEIISICNYDNNSNQNFIFEITDNALINNTGGIVQGMSGSPIIQNGKIIGAVTHVMINNPKRGYGIFIENMINISK